MYLNFYIFSPGRKITRSFCPALLFITALCGAASAQSGPNSVRLEGAQISLLSAPVMASVLLGDALTLQPDERLAFVSIVLDDGWKTYWRLPGRFGFAPLLDWSGSENVASVETIFPMPNLFDEGDGTSIGYSGEVLWPVRVQTVDAKEPIFLDLAVELGLCEELCIPVSADLGALLSPSAGEAASLSAILALAGSLPTSPERLPEGAFEQNDAGLTLSMAQISLSGSFAVAENDVGKHSLLQFDGDGALSGPWRHEIAPNRLTLVSPDTGMQIFLLGT